jgi:predicted HicB family RNase H-like nuclease
MQEGGDTMPTTKAGQKAVNKYMRENYDRVNLTMPKGRKDEVKAHADTRGESLNAFINRAIDSQIQRDTEEK